MIELILTKDGSHTLYDSELGVWHHSVNGALQESTLTEKKGENPCFSTNNALERYSRHFNGIVPSSHPNLVVFAHALREEAKSVSQRLEDVRKGREEAPTYSTSFIEIPKEFHSFKWPPVAVASKKRRVMKK